MYLQASLDSTPLQSGIRFLPTALIVSPFALLSGMATKSMKRYRPSNTIGWILTAIGFGLLSLLKANSSTGHWVGYQVVAAAGTGIIVSPLRTHIALEWFRWVHYTSSLQLYSLCWPHFLWTLLPRLWRSSATFALSLKLVQNAMESWFRFLSNWSSQTWGIAISGSILQNELKKRLPADFVAEFSAGTQIAYAAIPRIHQLPEPLRTEVQVAFADSLSMIWKVMIGISGIGVLALFLLKEIEMKTYTDTRFGLEEGKSSAASEIAVE